MAVDKMIMTSVYWDQSQPGITMTAPTIRHRDVSDKHVTGALKTKKIRGREIISVGTCNLRALRPTGKLEQLTRARGRYDSNIPVSARCAGKTSLRCQHIEDTRFISAEKRKI